MKNLVIILAIIVLIFAFNLYPRSETIGLTDACGPAITCVKDFEFTDYGLFTTSFEELAPGWDGLSIGFFDNHEAKVSGLIVNTLAASLLGFALLYLMQRLRHLKIFV